MTDIFLGPKRYVQRPGALADAGAELKAFGRRPMILGDELVLSILRPDLEKNLRSAGLSACFVLFGVECSLSEVARVADIGRFDNVDVIVGKVFVGPVPREAPPTTCPFRSTRRAFCAPSRKLRKG